MLRTKGIDNENKCPWCLTLLKAQRIRELSAFSKLTKANLLSFDKSVRNRQAVSKPLAVAKLLPIGFPKEDLPIIKMEI